MLKQISKTTLSRKLYHKAAIEGQKVMLEYDMVFPADSWDKPCIFYERNDIECLLQYNINEDTNSLDICFAWCGDNPKALAIVLLALRKLCREKDITEVSFTRHFANERMAKLTKKLKPNTLSYRIEI